MPIFDITKEDIAELDDTELRELIGRLCEAELYLSSYPLSGVLWGGNQKSPDGGLDAEVILEETPKGTDFICRKHTGFQAKREKGGFSANKIINEMKPNGKLRPIIVQLIQESGAYIIVSNSDDCTKNPMLDTRLNAMKNAISSEENSESLHVDFYDSNRLATWVRKHPPIILWIKQKIEKALTGWQPFGNWSNSPKGEKDIYLISNDICIHDVSSKHENCNLNIDEGINRLRKNISIERSATRLIGLSGVGKTRLVQALFEVDVSENPLDKSTAVYTDLGSEPEPSAHRMTEILVAQDKRIILIIDNCRPDVHRELTKIIKNEKSKVSLLTVEYDIRDDEKEATEVFRLEPASIGLITDLVVRRNNTIGTYNAEKIAVFSGGNARIAIALAKTIKQGESLGNLSDESLFERLFHQRNDKGLDQALIARAEALSLVYSYDGETTIGSNSELTVLASLIDETATNLHKGSAELMRRQLVQQRNKWRAVLPHAISNRLAKRALENIPKDLLISTLCTKGNERLLKSFTRRLSYLHDSVEAKAIVELWFSQGGFMGDPEKFDDNSIVLFKNLAPVCPEATLKVIERGSIGEYGEDFCSKDSMYFHDIHVLLFHLAFEKDLFERATRLFVRSAISESKSNSYSRAKNELMDLFMFQLNDGNVYPELRLKMIEEFINSDNLEIQRIGYDLLEVSLNPEQHRFPHDLEFGARSRDISYRTTKFSDIELWYSKVFQFSLSILDSNVTDQVTKRLLGIFENSFHGLWQSAKMHDELEMLVTKIRVQGIWIEGWRRIREQLDFDSDDLSIEETNKLKKMFKSLEPITFEEEVQFFVFGNKYHLSCVYADEYDEKEDPNYSLEIIFKKIRELSQIVALDIQQYSSIIRELVSIGEEFDHRFQFAEELSKIVNDKTQFWDELVCEYKKQPLSNRNNQALRGFICGAWETSPDLVNQWLNLAVADQDLRLVLVYLQTVIVIDNLGYKRLMDVLNYSDTPVHQFKLLHQGWTDDFPFSDDQYAELLSKILNKENGPIIALTMFSKRFPKRKDVVHKAADSLLAVGREIFRSVELDLDRRDHFDRLFSILAQYCIEDEVPDSELAALYESFKNKFTENFLLLQYPLVLQVMAKKHPQIFLDMFLLNSNIASIFSWNYKEHWKSPNPLTVISSEEILKWCTQNPEKRFLKIADLILFYDGYHMTETALLLLEKAPKPIEILDKYKEQYFFSKKWKGLGLASEIKSCRLALQELTSHENSVISQKSQLIVDELIEKEKEELIYEESRNKDREQSFE